MAPKNNVQTTIDHIFLSAMDLFREYGYDAVSIRMLADHADISLGLVNHYFGSKRNLAYIVLEKLIQYVILHVNEYVENTPENILLHDAVDTRVVNVYLREGAFRQFYLDTLNEDIFFNYLENRSTLILKQLQESYHFTITEDMDLLYSRYIPYIVEKTLILKKKEGLFPSISYEDIPYHIFSSTYVGRVPMELLENYDKKAREIAPEILASLAPIPSQEDLAACNLLPVQLSDISK